MQKTSGEKCAISTADITITRIHSCAWGLEASARNLPVQVQRTLSICSSFSKVNVFSLPSFFWDSRVS
jgi:hypothetical protein